MIKKYILKQLSKRLNERNTIFLRWLITFIDNDDPTYIGSIIYFLEKEVVDIHLRQRLWESITDLYCIDDTIYIQVIDDIWCSEDWGVPVDQLSRYAQMKVCIRYDHSSARYKLNSFRTLAL